MDDEPPNINESGGSGAEDSDQEWEELAPPGFALRLRRNRTNFFHRHDSAAIASTNEVNWLLSVLWQHMTFFHFISMQLSLMLEDSPTFAYAAETANYLYMFAGALLFQAQCLYLDIGDALFYCVDARPRQIKELLHCVVWFAPE